MGVQEMEDFLTLCYKKQPSHTSEALKHKQESLSLFPFYSTRSFSCISCASSGDADDEYDKKKQRVQLSVVKASSINHTTPHRRSGSSLDLESNTVKKTESSGLGSNEEMKERERDMVGETVEAILAALTKAIEYQAHKQKSSAMASGRERDVVGEMEEKDEVNQIEEYLNKALKALMLIKICKECTAMSSAMASGRTQIQAPESDTKNLQLRLSSRLPDIFYTGERKLGSEIHVELIDEITGNVVTSGPHSCAKLNVVVVKGNFDNNDRTQEDFRSHVVTDRVEKKLLTGAVELFLENGEALLPVPTFTDNSSWIQNKEIRLGVEVAPGFCEGIRVREAISNPFVVKDCRGKGNEKHYPPAPDDEVWRLKSIRRNGQFHVRLNKAGISKVRHFLWKLDKDPQGLMEILETKMTTGRWENLVEHAKTCDLSRKYYVYYADATKTSGVVFKNVFESCGLIEEGKYHSAAKFSERQKVYADELILAARDDECDGWKSIVEYHDPMLSGMKACNKRPRISPANGATGAHTDQQVREPAIGGVHSLIAGDGSAASSDRAEQANGNTALPVEGVHSLIAGDGSATSSDPTEQANGNTALLVESVHSLIAGDGSPTSSDLAKQANGNTALPVEAVHSLIAGDGSATSSDRAEQANGNTALPVEGVHSLIAGDGSATSSAPTEHANGNTALPIEGVHSLIAGDGSATSSDRAEQANGNTALPVEGVHSLIAGDGYATSSAPTEHANGNRALPIEGVHSLIAGDGSSTSLDPVELMVQQANGNTALPVEGVHSLIVGDGSTTSSDPAEQANGNTALPVEACKKRQDPLASDDEVWRLATIIENGHFHDRLNKAGIFKVKEFLWKLGIDRQGLREILGTTMTDGNWETLVEHAETCDLSGKYYVYYADATKTSGVVFENVFDPCGLIEGGVYYLAAKFSDRQKVSVETLIRDASDNKFDRWKHIEEYQITDLKGLEVFTSFNYRELSVEYHDPMLSGMEASNKRPRLSPANGATGAHTHQQVREPAIGGVHSLIAGDGSATSSDPAENPLFDGTIDLTFDWDSFLDLTTDDEPRLSPAPDPPNLADGTNELSVEGEREHFPSTDRVTWASENFGNNQASRDQALVNQRLDVGDPAVPFDQQAPAPCQATFRSFRGQVPSLSTPRRRRQRKKFRQINLMTS